VIARTQQGFENYRAQFAPETIPMVGEGETAILNSVRNELEEEGARRLQATLGLSRGAVEAEAKLRAALRDIEDLKRSVDLGRDREARLEKDNADLRDFQDRCDETVTTLRKYYDDLTEERQVDVQVRDEEIRRLKQKLAAAKLTPDQEKTQKLLDEIQEKEEVIKAMETQIAEQDENANTWSEEVDNYEKTIEQLRGEVDERDGELDKTNHELEIANREIERATKKIKQQAVIIGIRNRDTNEQSNIIANLIREVSEAKVQLSHARTSSAENAQIVIDFEKEVVLANISSVQIYLTFMVVQRALHGWRSGDTAAAQEAANLAVQEAEELYEDSDLVAVARYWRGIVRYYNGDQRVAFEEFKAAAADWQGEEDENLAAWIAAANPDTGVEAPRRRDGYRAGLGFNPQELRASKFSPYQVEGDVKLRPHLYVRPLSEEGQQLFDTIVFDNDFDYENLSPEQQALFSFEPPVGDFLPQLSEDYPLPPSPRYGSADLPRRSQGSHTGSEYGGVAPISTSPSSATESGARPPSHSSLKETPAPAPPPEPSRLTDITTNAALHIQFLVAQLDEASQRIRELESGREVLQNERNVRLRREAQIRELRQEVAGLEEELEYVRRPWWRWGLAR
jgi:TolA-binding protein